MTLGMGGLHFEVADFIGLVNSNDTTKIKLAILSFLCCRKFVKNLLVPIAIFQ